MILVSGAIRYFPAAFFLCCGDKWGGEFFVEGENEFDALAVVFKLLRAIAEVDGAINLRVSFDEGGGRQGSPGNADHEIVGEADGEENPGVFIRKLVLLVV